MKDQIKYERYRDMKKILSFLPLIILSSFILQSCSSSEQTIKKEEEKADEEIYVFDEIPPDTVKDVEEDEYYTPLLTETYYKVQIGAFTTKEKAEEFASESRIKLQKKLDVSYSDEVNLFVVRISSSFNTRSEAEKVRNQLWQIEEFKDAWIVTVNK
jgi:hypothetical protein